MINQFFYIISILPWITNIYCSPSDYSTGSDNLLAHSDTPVWFLEPNSRDPLSPRLRRIANPFVDSGLVLQNQQEKSILHSNSNNTNSISKDTLYLETIVVVDYNLYEKIGGTVASTLEYLISFWYGVDSRYKLITTPEVQISIAGIVIAASPDVLFYVHQSKNEKGYPVANKILFEGGKFFLYSKQIKNYDIVVTMTTENICSMDDLGFCNPSIVGLSLLGKACHSHLNTAIIEDNGGFSGIIPAAHELAHLLNVPHDGSNGAVRCRAFNGYIMTPSASVTENNFRWSSCSLKIFGEFSLSNSASCLNNVPSSSGFPVEKVLPGRLMSADEQCTRAGYGPPCPNDKKICNALSCFRVNMMMCDTDGPAAEGTSCGENSICLDGSCVREE